MSKNSEIIEDFKKSLSATIKSIGKKEDIEINFVKENLFDEVKKEDRKISMATIYNTLKQFTSLGLIREIVVDQNKSLYCNNNKSHYHLYIEDEGKIHDIPTKNINLDIPSIPACLSLHNIDVIVRVRSLKEDQKKN